MGTDSVRTAHRKDPAMRTLRIALIAFTAIALTVGSAVAAFASTPGTWYHG